MMTTRAMIDVDWRPMLAERLAATAHKGGGWSYRPGPSIDTEPTALAALALTAVDAHSELVTAALKRLAALQQPDGAAPVSSTLSSPHWPTALMLLALRRCAAEKDADYSMEMNKATEWLLQSHGKPLPLNPHVRDHDSTIIGWSWVAGTHSWVEPSAYAICALRAVGRAADPRVREGVRLLLDRALPAGGWNYGNRRVFEHALLPFPATSGIALAAVAGEQRGSRIDAALSYLANELKHVRAPLSLAWGLIGLRAWHATGDERGSWLSVCAERLASRRANPHYDAMLLLAGAPRCPFSAENWGDCDE